jgi:tRNA threonylcarbamoyl adenosine modification protein YeaZ
MRSESLLPEIVSLIEKAGVSRKAIAAVAVSAGPGSFTGIRIGLATALGLARGLHAELSQISLFEALAFGRERAMLVVPMGRGMYAIACKSGGKMSPPEIAAEERLRERCSELTDYEVVGPGEVGNGLLTAPVSNLAAAIAIAASDASVNKASEPLFLSSSGG